MHEVSLAAASRRETGKGSARSLRRDGKVPAVIYGHGREPQALSIEIKAVDRLLGIIGGETMLVDVAIDGALPVKAIVREVQRNPVRRADVIHLDLYAVVADELITVEVPVHVIGTAEGVRNQGGVLDLHVHRVTVRCLPADIPEHLEIDVTNLTVGQAIHIRELSVPKGELMNDPDVSVVGVLAARIEAVATPVVTDGEPEVIKKGKAEDAEAAGE
jgi:large subunit ribosomal protein L25